MGKYESIVRSVVAPVLFLVIVVAVLILVQKAYTSFMHGSDLIVPAVVRHDDVERGVSCWISQSGGISCLRMPLD